MAQGSQCAEEVRVTQKPRLTGLHHLLHPPQGLVLVFGTWKGEGFHRSSSFTIKCLKSTVSEEDEEEQTPHTFWNSNTQTETEAGRADPFHTPTHPGWRTSYSHSHLTFLLCSQPWSTRRLEAGRGPCNHTKSTSPALKPPT